MEATSRALLFMCNGLLVLATAYAPHEGHCGRATCQKWQHIMSDDGEESSLLQLSRDSLETIDAKHVEVISDDERTSSSSFGQGCVGNECSESLDDAKDEDSFLQTQKGLVPQPQFGSPVKGKDLTTWSQVKDKMEKVWKKSPIAGCNGFDCIEQYVKLPDKSYQWQDTGFRVTGDGSMYDKNSNVKWTGYVLNMTSQTWPVPVNNPVWWHLMVVIVPDNQDIFGRATLDLNYGIELGQGTNLEWRIDNRNIDQPEAAKTPGAQSLKVDADNLKQSLDLVRVAVEKAAYWAITTRSIVASLMNPINSYQVFQDDLLGLERVNDILKAYTYNDFMRHPDHPEIIIEMPVTKAIVRAMDTITAFTATLATPIVSEFMVAGLSKLGTASFIACALDARVKACAPMGIPMAQLGNYGAPGAVDPLKIHKAEEAAFEKLPKHSTEGFKYAFMHALTKSSAWQKWHHIVDPTEWWTRLTKPMLWVNAASDDFILHKLLFNDTDTFQKIPGPSSMYIEPNSYHINLLVQSLPTTSAFLRGFLLGKTTPNISSTFDPHNKTLTVRQISQHRPTKVRLWTGKGLQFHDTIINETSPQSGNWSVNVSGASYISLTYQWPEPGFNFTISTVPTGTPHAYPVPMR